jgi:GT2 family glycosyltransferase/glycosyltransferase involved in cell wall biosynthesis
MSSQTVGLRVVVVTYNSAAHVAEMLSSLDAGLADVGPWDLVIADNASTDATVDLVRAARPEARVVAMGRNAGYAAAINAALAADQHSGPALILNPDVRLRPGCARHLLDALDQPGVGIAFPRLCTRDGRTSWSLRRDPSVLSVWAEALLGGGRAARLGLSEVIADPRAYRESHDVEWATGAVLAVSAQCQATVGAWDETFFLYSEEVDYVQRAREAGFTARYVPLAVAEHDAGAYGSDTALWQILVGNRLLHYARHHSSTSTIVFRAGLAVGELVRAGRGAAHRAGLRSALSPARSPQPPGSTALNTEPSAPEDAGGGSTDAAVGVIWFAAQDWWYHNQAHSDFQLMQEVARHRPVLVVNSLGLRLPRKGTSTKPWRRILRKVRSTAKFVRRPVPGNPGFHVMTPVILPFYGESAGATLSAWLVRQQVRLVARLVGVGSAPAIGATIPTAWPVVRPMRRSTLLYNRADLHSAFPEADGSWVLSLENALLEHADHVLYVSSELQRADVEHVGARAVFLDHGVDLDHFNPDGPVATEIETIDHPRIGFFGGLDDYVVDMDLLLRVAKALPDAHLMLIGDATCSMAALTAQPNVHWLGFRPYAQIPSLGRGFDVAIMPWLDNEWIRFANPIKLKEYLALGLPVVTTEYPEVEPYRGEIAVATSPEDFIDLISSLLRDPGDAAPRRASVLEFSWRRRAEVLLELIPQPRSS